MPRPRSNKPRPSPPDNLRSKLPLNFFSNLPATVIRCIAKALLPPDHFIVPKVDPRGLINFDKYLQTADLNRFSQTCKAVRDEVNVWLYEKVCLSPWTEGTSTIYNRCEGFKYIKYLILEGFNFNTDLIPLDDDVIWNQLKDCHGLEKLEIRVLTNMMPYERGWEPFPVGKPSFPQSSSITFPHLTHLRIQIITFAEHAAFPVTITSTKVDQLLNHDKNIPHHNFPKLQHLAIIAFPSIFVGLLESCKQPFVGVSQAEMKTMGHSTPVVYEAAALLTPMVEMLEVGSCGPKFVSYQGQGCDEERRSCWCKVNFIDWASLKQAIKLRQLSVMLSVEHVSQGDLAWGEFTRECFESSDRTDPASLFRKSGNTLDISVDLANVDTNDLVDNIVPRLINPQNAIEAVRTLAKGNTALESVKIALAEDGLRAGMDIFCTPIHTHWDKAWAFAKVLDLEIIRKEKKSNGLDEGKVTKPVKEIKVKGKRLFLDIHGRLVTEENWYRPKKDNFLKRYAKENPEFFIPTMVSPASHS